MIFIILCYHELLISSFHYARNSMHVFPSQIGLVECTTAICAIHSNCSLIVWKISRLHDSKTFPMLLLRHFPVFFLCVFFFFWYFCLMFRPGFKQKAFPLYLDGYDVKHRKCLCRFLGCLLNEPRQEKTRIWVLRPGRPQTGLHSYRS